MFADEQTIDVSSANSLKYLIEMEINSHCFAHAERITKPWFKIPSVACMFADEQTIDVSTANSLKYLIEIQQYHLYRLEKVTGQEQNHEELRLI